jgi:hypothetical protein
MPVDFYAFSDELVKIALDVPQKEVTDARDIQQRSLEKDPEFSLSGPWKKFVRKQDGFKVYCVDGEWVRNNLTIEFGHGGHGLVHECIPMDEIWLGAQHFKDCKCKGTVPGRPVTPAWFESCLLHEIAEFRQMNQGDDYWKAHKDAIGLEKDLGILADPHGDPAPRASLEKIALYERLKRLAYTDLPNSPRLLMRKRSPQELAAIQADSERSFQKHYLGRIQRATNPAISKLPEGKIRHYAERGRDMLASDPIGFAAAHAGPVLAAGPAAAAVPVLPQYIGAKKGLEGLIDKHLPMAEGPHKKSFEMMTRPAAPEITEKNFGHLVRL